MTTTTNETFVVKRSGHAVIDKDPDATLDYVFDWTEYLLDINDTIERVTWVLDPSLTKTDEGFNDTKAVVWVSGGIAPLPPALNEVPITCRITTAGGRIDDRTIYLKIVER